MTESGDGRSVSLLKRGVSMAAEVTLCPLVGDKVICGEKNEGRNNKHTHKHTNTGTHIHTHAHTHTHTQHTTPKMCAHPHTSSPPSLTQFWGIRGKREPLCVCHRQNLSHTHTHTHTHTHARTRRLLIALSASHI